MVAELYPIVNICVLGVCLKVKARLWEGAVSNKLLKVILNVRLPAVLKL